MQKLIYFIPVLWLLVGAVLAEDNALSQQVVLRYDQIAGEKSLQEKVTTNKADLAYRLSFEPTQIFPPATKGQPPPYFIIVYFNFDEDKQVDTATGRLEVKTLRAEGGISKSERKLTGREALELINMFRDYEVFGLPFKQDMTGEGLAEGEALDLSAVTIERVRAGEYRAVRRWVPVAGPVAGAVNMLNDLAK